jgi:hypothetical protein
MFPPLKQIVKNIKIEGDKTTTVQMIYSGNGKGKYRGDKSKGKRSPQNKPKRLRRGVEV